MLEEKNNGKTKKETTFQIMHGRPNDFILIQLTYLNNHYILKMERS